MFKKFLFEFVCVMFVVFVFLSVVFIFLYLFDVKGLVLDDIVCSFFFLDLFGKLFVVIVFNIIYILICFLMVCCSGYLLVLGFYL